MTGNSELKLECLAIGSLPHNNLENALSLVKNCFNSVPFWPQLTKINKNEDMIVQFLENMPSFFICNDKCCMETESDKFFEGIEQFYADYEEITSDINAFCLDKYAISKKYSCAFPEFLEIIKDTKPKFAKGQIVGPFTLATTLVDKQGRCAIYDETLREIIVKTLSLKALWQIKKIKDANPATTPIIFIDEPSISQLGTSAYITVSQTEVSDMIKEIVEVIHTHEAMCAIHCCGKCDWKMPVKAGVDIINLDAYSYAQNLSLFKNDLEKFLLKGGIIAWGIVPTLDKEALEKADIKSMLDVFLKGVKYLTNKGIDEKLIIDNSVITPSCGAGGLSIELAEKAMKLTKQLSDTLKERYRI